MARVSGVAADALPPDLRRVYEQFAHGYADFGNQVAVMAHVPSALRHLMGMLLELREQRNIPIRYIELAILTVSKLNACTYCVAHHKPLLIVEGLTPQGAEGILDYKNHPELDEVDRLVVEYAVAVTQAPQRIRDAMFERLRRHFSESQIVELTLRIALGGFFNRFNDALMIETEPGVPA